VSSADGTAIAYERHGAGAPVVVVGGALCDRARLRDTAVALAAHQTAIVYDRRGRGDSGDCSRGLDFSWDSALAREIEDLAAVVAAADGPAAVYGHSSGAALAMHAAAAGVPVSHLVLHEPPFGPDTDEQREEAAAYVAALTATLAEGRNDDAVALFLRVTGMPGELVDAARGEPWFAMLTALAPSLVYDSEAMGNRNGGTVPVDVAGRVPASTLVLVGGASPPFMADSARALAAVLPRGRVQVLPGEEHVVEPAVLAPVVEAFLAT
jgi:pimeloyl-ACP methyl ester carboxylesterase